MPDGSIQHTPNQMAYFAKHYDKGVLDVISEVDERANVEKIRFIEGAIKQYFFYQHLPGVYKDFKDARTGLKWATEHTTFEMDEKGNSKEVTRSMADIYANNKRTQAFIDKCEEYFRENGYKFPDSEHFGKWRDTAPSPSEVYPPVEELKAKYLEMM